MYPSILSLRTSWLFLGALCAALWGVSFLFPLTYPVIYTTLASVVIFGGVAWTGRILVSAWMCEILFGASFGAYIVPALCMVAVYALFQSVVVVQPIEDIRTPSFSQVGIAVCGVYALAFTGWAIDALVFHALSTESLRSRVYVWARWSWMLTSAFVSVCVWLVGVALARTSALR
ncbi:MAG: hypothetical protein AAB608_00520 [Patescibacteria group bacterium]